MVSHINVAVDDDTLERAKRIKQHKNWSWEQYIEASIKQFEDDFELSEGGE